MTKYQYLLAKKEEGELSILLQIGLPTQILFQMDIYAFHLLHPTYSHVKLANELDTTHSTVQRALSFMDQPVTTPPKNLG